jgi:hypothetical protein
VTTHQQTADSAAVDDSGRQQLAVFSASLPVSWTFNRIAHGNGKLWVWVDHDLAVQQLMEQVTTSGSHAAAQQQQQQQQQQPLWEELQQLLGSGKLQSWLAAASGALPLR